MRQRFDDWFRKTTHKRRFGTGAHKQAHLAWRGWPNANGAIVDDFGVPTNIGANEGDIRTAPFLLPIF